jgi:transglutaminase-like putative cysteine protease
MAYDKTKINKVFMEEFVMKKLMMTAVIFMIFTIALSSVVFAGVKWDQTTVNDGYLTVTYDGDFSKDIKVYVTRDGVTTNDAFSLTTNNSVVIPLQLGNGNYTVSLLQLVQGNSYKPLDSIKFSQTLTGSNDRFKLANAYVIYNKDMKFLQFYTTSYEKLASTNDKIRKFYDDVVRSYKYDTEKAANLPKGYVPVIDKTYESKKGICSDYSTLVAGYLRGIGVPTKLIMGYNPAIPEYHAWNEILIDGKWMVVDATYDSAYVNANQPYTMEKDGSKFTIVKVY